MNYLEALRWRYSVKKFNGEKISEQQLQNILEAGRLSASSLGIQPYYILVVCDKDKLEYLKPAFYNPSQISTCSHLLVLVSKKNINKDYLDNYFHHIKNERGVSLEQLTAFRNNIDNFIAGHSPVELENWSEKQTYILLGTLMNAAAEEKVDSCPMEGFDRNELTKQLNLDQDNDKASVVLALGYRAEDDIFQNYKKVRKPTEKFIKYF